MSALQAVVRPALLCAELASLFLPRGRPQQCFHSAYLPGSGPHSLLMEKRDCLDSSSLEAVKIHLASVKTPHKTSQHLGKTRQHLESLQGSGRKHDAQAGLELLIQGIHGGVVLMGRWRGSQAELRFPKGLV